MRLPGCKLAVLLIAVGLAAGCGGSSPASNLQRAVNADWSSYKIQHGVPGGGVAVYLTTASGNYFASSGMPSAVDENTHFRIASNTKSFTAAAIMLLGQQGKLRLDDTITSSIPGTATPYIPEGSAYDIPYKSQITIRQLLNHTAGVFDVTNETMPSSCPAPYADQAYILYVEGNDRNHQFSPAELVGVDALCQTSYFAPGTGYHYSNTDYSLAVMIIERVSGLTYDEFVRQNLIVPNQLSATTVPMLGNDSGLPSPYTDGYLYCQGDLSNVTQDNMSANIGEGNIISTPADLARWIKRLISGQAGVSPDSVVEMKTATTQSGSSHYGLGILHADGLGYGHNGAHEGYLSLMMYDPDTDVAIVLYFNVWDESSGSLSSDQIALLLTIAQDAKKALNY